MKYLILRKTRADALESKSELRDAILLFITSLGYENIFKNTTDFVAYSIDDMFKKIYNNPDNIHNITLIVNMIKDLEVEKKLYLEDYPELDKLL